MRKIILLFVLAFFLKTVSAQIPLKLLLNHCENSDYSAILNESYKDVINSSENGWGARKWIFDLEREIVADFFAVQYLVDVNLKDNDSILENRFTLKIIRKDSTIVFYKLFDEKNKFEKSDEKRLQELKATYRKYYKTELDFTELFANEIRYGDACGIAGVKPKYRKILDSIITEKDVKTLIKWLKSPFSGLQVYAIEGIYELEKQGVYFEKEVWEIIDFVALKQQKINICSGCLGDNLSVTEIVKQIKKDYQK